MTFTIVYRDSSGKRKSLELNVSSKADIWPELKRMGISAISVVEGSRKYKSSSKKFLKSPYIYIAIIATLSAALGVIGILHTKKATNDDKEIKTILSKKNIKVEKYHNPNSQEKTADVDKISLVKETQQRKTLETYIDEAGVERYKGGLRVQKGVSEVSIDLGKNRKPDIFKNYADSRIAFLLTIEPGEMIFGDYDYNHPRFKKELERALVTKIEIHDEDSEEDKALKKAVTETKEELIKALKRGESITDILSESQREMQRLGQFKREAENMIREISKDTSATVEDIEKYVEVVNQALAEKGIAPLKLNCVSKRALQLRRNNQK